MERDPFWHLQNFNIFKAVPMTDMMRLQDMINTDHIRQKEPVFLSGQGRQWIYFLKEGLVKLAVGNPEGRTLTVALLKPGEIFGSLDAEPEGDESLEAIALEDSFLCRIRSDAFLAYAENNPGLMLSVNKLLGLRIRKVQAAVCDMVFLDVPGRLAKLLYTLSQSDGVREAGGVRIPIRLSHQEVANLVGASRELVSLTLGRFAGQGLVIQSQRRYVVPDPSRLLALFS